MNKKRNHYVPKFYLRNFSSNNLISVLDIPQNIIHVDTPYSTHCRKNYLYGKDGIREDSLSLLEGQWAVEIKNIVDGIFDFSKSAITSIKQFVMYQNLRTPIALDKTKNTFVQMTEKLLPIIAQSEGVIISSSEIVPLAQEIIDNQQMEFSEINFDMIDDLEKSIDDLGLMIIDNTGDYQFVSSDHPVVVNNFFQSNEGFGADCFGIIYMIPISSSKYIVIFDKNMYPKLKDKSIVCIDDDKIIQSLNIYQYYNSDYLFSENKESLERFQIVDSDDILKRNALIRKILHDKPFLNQDHVKLFVDKIDSIDDLIPDPRVLLKYKREPLEFFDISLNAIRFTKDTNLMYWRHRGNPEMIQERISLIRASYSNSPENTQLIDGYEEFLYWYFDLFEYK
ncbi:MAG: DUF4238 domain-containing protein [Candidatus Izemoplasmatales bacterium]